MKTVVIEKAKLKNIPEIEKIYLKTSIDEFRTQFPKINKKKILEEKKRFTKKRLAKFKRSLRSNKNILLIFKDKDVIGGFGQATIDQYDKTRAMVDKIYLLKKFRNKGIGKKILKQILNQLKEKGVKRIQGRAFIKNTPSIKIQEKLGFKPLMISMEKRLI